MHWTRPSNVCFSDPLDYVIFHLGKNTSRGKTRVLNRLRSLTRCIHNLILIKILAEIKIRCEPVSIQLTWHQPTQNKQKWMRFAERWGPCLSDWCMCELALVHRQSCRVQKVSSEKRSQLVLRRPEITRGRPNAPAKPTRHRFYSVTCHFYHCIWPRNTSSYLLILSRGTRHQVRKEHLNFKIAHLFNISLFKCGDLGFLHVIIRLSYSFDASSVLKV
jgi:hypothetical protein